MKLSATNKKSPAAEKNFKNSEEMYRLLAEHVKDFVWIMNPDLSFKYISPSMEKASGYTLSELDKLSPDRFLTGVSYRRDLEMLAAEIPRGVTQTAPAGQKRSLEIELRCKDGYLIMIEASLSILPDKNGKPYAILGEGRDITERRKMEEILQKSESRYRLLADNITEHVWLMDLTTLKVTYVSPSVTKMYGYDLHEISKVSLRKILTEESFRKMVEAVVKEIPKAAEITPPQVHQHSLELEARHKDGHCLWIDSTISYLRDEGGSLSLVLGETRDITERKMAQEALKKGEEQYRLLADHMKDQVWLMDLNMNITYVSPSVERLTGYTSDEMRSLSLDKLLAPDSLKRAIEFTSVRMPKAMKESSKDSIFRTFELEFILKDGKTIWGECSFNFIRDDEGKVVSILGEARDITERKKIEEKLQDEEQRFRALAEQSSDIIIMINGEGRITYENPAVRVLGINPEERLGASVFERVHPDDLKLITDAFHTLFSDVNAPVQKNEVRIRHADGSWRTFDTMGSNLVRDNVIEAAIVNLRDITERKEADEKLKETLESLKKAVGTTIQVLVTALESRDPYTAGHQLKSAELACAIAAEMGLDEHRIEGLRMAGVIHDIGKLSIPAEILSKPTKLSNIEYSLIKVHPESGYEMLKNVESPWPLAQVVHQHHERMNGSGYPRNLKGDEILMEARIMAVADVVEAMASHRPYRASLGIESALEEIEKNQGILYDENVVDACLRLFREKGYNIS
jgi:PAS domain S-box-containing protein